MDWNFFFASVLCVVTIQHMHKNKRLQSRQWLELFQVAFGLPIAFWSSVEGSVIEMKPTPAAPEDNTKSQAITSEWKSVVKSMSQKSRKAYNVASHTLVWE